METKNTYQVGVIESDGRRQLYIVETGRTVARVNSDAGPALLGDMDEARARELFGDEMSDFADAAKYGG